MQSDWFRERHHLHGVVTETTSTIDDLLDFDVYCSAVEISTQHIRRLAAQEVR